MQQITGYQAMLLGAQAAGIGANVFAAYQQKRAVEAGISVEQGDLRLRMEQEELAFTEANIESIRNLQEVMATQRAIAGARGQNPGVGSSLAVANKSIRAQKADEQARGLSKSFRKSQYENMSRLLNVKKATAKAAFGGSLIESGMSTLSLNTTIGEFIQQNKTKGPNLSKTGKATAKTYKDFPLKGSIYG